jgi:hypothetical protein
MDVSMSSMFFSGHKLSARPLDMAARDGVGIGQEVPETFNRRMPGQLHDLSLPVSTTTGEEKNTISGMVGKNKEPIPLRRPA